MSLRARRTLAYLLALVPAAAFLAGGVLKGADPSLFADQITGHGITPASWSPYLAYLFVAVELLLGLALVLWMAPRLALFLSVALLLFFMGVTAAAWAMGNAEACGCFGRLAGRGPEAVLLEDALFLAASALAFVLLGRARVTAPNGRRALFIGLAALSVVYVAVAKDLPVDGWVTGVRPGRDLSDLSVEGVRFALDDGRLLLVFVEPSCARCAEAVPGLKAIASAHRGTRVALVVQGTSRDAAAWRLEHLPPFAVGYASRRVLSQYMRRVPSAFLLESGVVLQTFWGRIPDSSDFAGSVAEPV